MTYTQKNKNLIHLSIQIPDSLYQELVDKIGQADIYDSIRHILDMFLEHEIKPETANNITLDEIPADKTYANVPPGYTEL